MSATRWPKGYFAKRYRQNVKPSPKERALPRLHPDGESVMKDTPKRNGNTPAVDTWTEARAGALLDEVAQVLKQLHERWQAAETRVALLEAQVKERENNEPDESYDEMVDAMLRDLATCPRELLAIHARITEEVDRLVPGWFRTSAQESTPA